MSTFGAALPGRALGTVATTILAAAVASGLFVRHLAEWEARGDRDDRDGHDQHRHEQGTDELSSPEGIRHGFKDRPPQRTAT